MGTGTGLFGKLLATFSTMAAVTDCPSPSKREGGRAMMILNITKKEGGGRTEHEGRGKQCYAWEDLNGK